MPLMGSDHMEIGTVEEVVAASETHEPHLRLSRGVIFRTDIYIPLNAVVKHADGVAFINVPGVLAAKMPWDEPPTWTEQRTRMGPPAGEVGRLYRSRSPSIEAES